VLFDEFCEFCDSCELRSFGAGPEPTFVSEYVNPKRPLKHLESPIFGLLVVKFSNGDGVFW
jgi:hypothetical protein